MGVEKNDGGLMHEAFGGDAVLRDGQAFADLAVQAAEPVLLESGKAYAVQVPAGGSVAIVDRTGDAFLDRPRRKAGTFDVYDAAAFAAYVDKHGLPESEVWQDIAKQKLLAVLDAAGDTPEATAWAGHRVQLVLRQTPAWKAWSDKDGAWLDQTAFAEHIQANLPDIVDPVGAVMLELAETFQAKTEVNFKSATSTASGMRSLVYEENGTASAGANGSIAIPKEIKLGLKPFYGGGRFEVGARFRYRITRGTLQLGYVLDRPHDVLEQAFVKIVEDVEERLGDEHPIWEGTPA